MISILERKEPVSVWIIEDSHVYRESLELSIDRTEGFVCSMSFNCCEDAIAYLKKHQAPDVMLVDIRLGEEKMNGVEGVVAMKQINGDLPFIMVTEINEKDLVFSAICAGACGYLLKSSRRFDIIDAIERVLAGGAIIDVPIARRALDMFSRLNTPQPDYGLTVREKEVLSLMVDGHTKRQISDILFLSPHTIDGHIRRIYAKLEVHNKSGAITKVFKENLLG